MMDKEFKKLDNMELENVSGGNDGLLPADEVHNLAWFVEHTVSGLPAGTSLIMKSTHGTSGYAMPGHQFFNGDKIWIHSRYWEGGCFLAYDNGEYGYVDFRYVR